MAAVSVCIEYFISGLVARNCTLDYRLRPIESPLSKNSRLGN